MNIASETIVYGQENNDITYLPVDIFRNLKILKSTACYMKKDLDLYETNAFRDTTKLYIDMIKRGLLQPYSSLQSKIAVHLELENNNNIDIPITFFTFGTINGLNNDKFTTFKQKLLSNKKKTTFYNALEEEFKYKLKGMNILSPDISKCQSVPIAYVSCGHRHCILVTKYGDAYSYGNGGAGKLGHGDELDQIKPKKITAFEGEDAIIKEAACGRDHSIILDTRGRAFGCGWGEYGRLGLGEDVGICLTPTLITIGNNSTDVVASNNFFLVAGAAGREHSLVLDSLGNVFAFGAGMFGQLGLYDEERKEPLSCAVYPTAIDRSNFGDESIVQVCCGEIHSTALSESGVLYTFGFQVTLGRGENNESECEDSSILPVNGLPLGGIIQVSCNGFVTVVRTCENFVFVWGDLRQNQEIPSLSKPYKLKYYHDDGESFFLASDIAASDHFIVLTDLKGNVYTYDEDGTFKCILVAKERRVRMIEAGTFFWIASLEEV